jgi:hypothetical protein
MEGKIYLVTEECMQNIMKMKRNFDKNFKGLNMKKDVISVLS